MHVSHTAKKMCRQAHEGTWTLNLERADQNLRTCATKRAHNQYVSNEIAWASKQGKTTQLALFSRSSRLGVGACKNDTLFFSSTITAVVSSCSFDDEEGTTVISPGSNDEGTNLKQEEMGVVREMIPGTRVTKGQKKPKKQNVPLVSVLAAVAAAFAFSMQSVSVVCSFSSMALWCWQKT